MTSATQRFECVWHMTGIAAEHKRRRENRLRNIPNPISQFKSSLGVEDAVDAEGRPRDFVILDLKLQFEGDDSVAILADVSPCFLARMKLTVVDGNDGSDREEIFGTRFEFERRQERKFDRKSDGSRFTSGGHDEMTVRLEVEFAVAEDNKFKLSDDLRRFVSTGLMSDVALVCGVQTLPAHKLLLAARSPVFLTMFRSDFKEAKDNRVKIDNYAAEVVQLFLHFLATDDVPADQLTLHARQLYSMGHQYQVEALKNACRDQLASCPGNWFAMLNLAEKYEDERLFSVAVRELARKRGVVMESQMWKVLERDRPDIITKLMAGMIRRSSVPKISTKII